MCQIQNQDAQEFNGPGLSRNPEQHGKENSMANITRKRIGELFAENIPENVYQWLVAIHRDAGENGIVKILKIVWNHTEEHMRTPRTPSLPS